MPVISTNTASNSAVRYLNLNANQESSALSKLSSGSRITQASDDAAGLAISTRISSDVTTLQQAATNASQATSILQTADGGASNISDILARMKSLASESASGTVTDSSRTYINSEFTQLSSEVDSIATGTRYSGQSLLDGTSTFASGVSVLVGSSASDTITITIASLKASTLGINCAQRLDAGRCHLGADHPRHRDRYRVGCPRHHRRTGIAFQLQRESRSPHRRKIFSRQIRPSPTSTSPRKKQRCPRRKSRPRLQSPLKPQRTRCRSICSSCSANSRLLDGPAYVGPSFDPLHIW